MNEFIHVLTLVFAVVFGCLTFGALVICMGNAMDNRRLTSSLCAVIIFSTLCAVFGAVASVTV